MAEIIKTDGTRTAATPANGEYFTLEEMQVAVGGMVEIIELDEKQSMILNEEASCSTCLTTSRQTRYSTSTIPRWTTLWVMCFYVKTNI